MLFYVANEGFKNAVEALNPCDMGVVSVAALAVGLEIAVVNVSLVLVLLNDAIAVELGTTQHVFHIVGRLRLDGDPA